MLPSASRVHSADEDLCARAGLLDATSRFEDSRDGGRDRGNADVVGIVPLDRGGNLIETFETTHRVEQRDLDTGPTSGGRQVQEIQRQPAAGDLDNAAVIGRCDQEQFLQTSFSIFTLTNPLCLIFNRIIIIPIPGASAAVF
jgi:hypothetical protein